MGFYHYCVDDPEAVSNYPSQLWGLRWHPWIIIFIDISMPFIINVITTCMYSQSGLQEVNICAISRAVNHPPIGHRHAVIAAISLFHQQQQQWMSYVL
jgi:hypothetical protein